MSEFIEKYDWPINIYYRKIARKHVITIHIEYIQNIDLQLPYHMNVRLVTIKVIKKNKVLQLGNMFAAHTTFMCCDIHGREIKGMVLCGI